MPHQASMPTGPPTHPPTHLGAHHPDVLHGASLVLPAVLHSCRHGGGQGQGGAGEVSSLPQLAAPAPHCLATLPGQPAVAGKLRAQPARERWRWWAGVRPQAASRMLAAGAAARAQQNIQPLIRMQRLAAAAGDSRGGVSSTGLQVSRLPTWLAGTAPGKAGRVTASGWARYGRPPCSVCSALP
jgi:hypothetical protein